MKTSIISILASSLLAIYPSAGHAAEPTSYEALAAAGAAAGYTDSPAILPARAQVSLRPLMLIYNQIAVDYEQLVSPSWSVTGGVKVELSRAWTQSRAADALNAILGLNMPSRHSTGGFGAELGARHWLSLRPLHGFFLNPAVAYDYAITGLSNNNDGYGANDVPDVHRLILNLRAGHQWIFANHLALTVDGGIYYAHVYANKTYIGDRDDTQISRGSIEGGWRSAGFAPELHVGIGGWF